jgi:HTH-type transcriptional regulator/antitoxin HigA
VEVVEMKPVNQYKPDYVSPPGETIRDHMSAWGLSEIEAAIRLGIAVSDIYDLLTGKMIIDKKLARRLSGLCYGTSESFWLNREKNYREWLEAKK